MFRKLVVAAVPAFVLAFATASFAQGQSGTRAEAQAMLEKAVAALKADQTKRLLTSIPQAAPSETAISTSSARVATVNLQPT